MGLDIAVYGKLVPTQGEGYDVHIYNLSDFAQRCTVFSDGNYHADWLMSFRAGSYSGYNRFREKIAELIDTTPDLVWKNPESYQQKPFYELINFADNEGALDYIVCERLAKDFEEYRGKAEASMDGYYFLVYENFLDAFKLAVEHKGVVHFG